LREIHYLVNYAIAEIPALMGLLIYLFIPKGYRFQIDSTFRFEHYLSISACKSCKNKSKDDYNPVQ